MGNNLHRLSDLDERLTNSLRQAPGGLDHLPLCYRPLFLFFIFSFIRDPHGLQLDTFSFIFFILI